MFERRLVADGFHLEGFSERRSHADPGVRPLGRANGGADGTPTSRIAAADDDSANDTRCAT